MAVTTYSSNGTPSDAVGVTGDFVIDYGGRFLWGPKPSDTAWAGSAKSIVGPTGPIAVNVLSTQSVGFGTGFVSTASLSATPVTGVYPGTTQTVAFVPQAATAFMGMSYTNPGTGTTTLTLLDQTANAPIFSATVTANATANLGPYTTTQYPMQANRSYVWQITGSGTANIAANPMYLFPAATPTYNVSQLSTATQIATTFSGTGKVLNAGASAISYAFRLPKVGYIYGFNYINTSPGALTLSVVANTGAGTLASFTIPASSSGFLGSYAIGTYTLAANTPYYFTVTGSGSGSLFIDTQVVFSIA